MRDREEVKRETALLKVLRMMAPGTMLREGVDNVLRARTGGLIVIGCDDQMRTIVDGGFAIDCECTPSGLYELAKMDGAIILSEDARRILYANAQLNPDPSIATRETGTRHRAAERTARQTQHVVVCVSERRNVITLYFGQSRYALKDVTTIVTKANQAIQTLERYRTVLDAGLANLSALEMEEMATLQEVVGVLQQFAMVARIRHEIRRYITELGTEGRLVSMQLEELSARLEEESYLLVKDYTAHGPDRTPHQILTELQQLDAQEILHTKTVAAILGYSGETNPCELPLSSRGFRILHKIPRLPQPLIENLAQEFDTLGQIVSATVEELDEVEGIGSARARTIKEGLRRVHDQAALDRNLYS